MLTKLNDLRSRKRLIFILATNYAYRIDPAVRRTGRVDQNYLLLPNDLVSRKRIISEALKGAAKGTMLYGLTKPAVTKLAKASLFLGYKDLEAAVRKSVKSDGDSLTLEASLNAWPRTTSLLFYRKPLRDGDLDREAILREFLPLASLDFKENQARFANEFVTKMADLAPISELRLMARMFVDSQNGIGGGEG
jgi:SpoVK/Ycf46/Vps4 family AAA+-type ATPase